MIRDRVRILCLLFLWYFMAKVLFQPLTDRKISVSCTITGQSRPAPEGVWVQGGWIEISCSYEVHIRKDEIEYKKDLKRKISVLK